MSKKMHTKKKKHRATCREMAKKGMVNGADGVFRSAIDKWTDNHLLAGYRVGRR